MIDPVYALNKLGLQSGMSVTRAITQIGMEISESTDPLQAANKIIVALGAKPVSKPIQAEIIAKALIEQAVVSGEFYKPEKAIIVAEEKYRKIELTMPYAFAGSSEDQNPNRKIDTKEKRGGDKKERALEIFNRESGKSGSEIAKIISAELDITFANAYYYVSRVFVKYSK